MTKPTTRRAVLLAALLVPAALARAEELKPAPADAVRGHWIATKSNGEVFAGGWSAELAAATPDVAVGSWTLTSEMGGLLMQGTWSARKAPRAWKGAWSARVAGGSVLSGTWEADAKTLEGAKTFQDMMKRAAQAQVAGTWRMGRTHGNWWLKP